MRRLMLLRHAKSDWPEGIADLERPLSPRGRDAAPRMGAYLTAEGLVPDRALVSPARRTRETLDLLKTRMPQLKGISSEPRIYDASAARLLGVIREQPREVHGLMLIGHNPGLADLAEMLVAAGAASAKSRMGEKFPTGALAVIDLPIDLWSETTPAIGRLDRFVTPRDLDKEA